MELLWTYQDSYVIQGDNSVEVPSYMRVDVAVYFRLNEGMRLQFNVENLLDEGHFPDAHSNDNISTGRPLDARLTLAIDSSREIRKLACIIPPVG